MLNFSLRQLSTLLASRKISSAELTGEFLKRIHALNSEYNAFITVDEAASLGQAQAADVVIASGRATPLTGIPVAQKDIFCARGWRTTCGSRMLANFISPYDANVIERFNAAGAVIIGKTNMDEFAMGSSNETSFYGPVKNPWDATAVPGGCPAGARVAQPVQLLRVWPLQRRARIPVAPFANPLHFAVFPDLSPPMAWFPATA
jgi:aspartyl-tRNA(Asn)/glutamyl-tRNA(Gln) amidotransferase subunit A